VESLDPNTGRLRFIEVKGRRADADTVTLTRNEILTCLNSPEQFILAVVFVDNNTVEACHYLENLSLQDPGFAATSVNYRFAELMQEKQ
ncbi:MAG: DUF3883 domain-containing protein, partial [Anaerolineaceae bacterium]